MSRRRCLKSVLQHGQVAESKKSFTISRCPCLALLCEHNAFEEGNDDWHASHEKSSARPSGKEGARRSHEDSIKCIRSTKAFQAISLSMISCHCCESAAMVGKPCGMTLRRSISESASNRVIHGRTLPCLLLNKSASNALGRFLSTRPQYARRALASKQSIDGWLRCCLTCKSLSATSAENLELPDIFRRTRIYTALNFFISAGRGTVMYNAKSNRESTNDAMNKTLYRNSTKDDPTTFSPRGCMLP